VETLEDDHTVALRRGDLTVSIDRRQGTVRQLTSAEAPEGWLAAPLADLVMIRQSASERFEAATVTGQGEVIRIERRSRDGGLVTITVRLADDAEAVDLHYYARDLPRPDGGVKAALKTTFAIKISPFTITPTA
jgi:hypothetical protein